MNKKILLTLILAIICITIITTSMFIYPITKINDTLTDEIITNPTNEYTTNLDNTNENFPSIDEIIKYMCSEDIGSRFISNEGNDISTQYLDGLFEKLELEPLWGDSYLDNFEHEYSKGEFQGDTFVETIKNLSLNNVVGKISGENSNNVIVLTAHFDAYGASALDNASGVATILKIANNLKNQLNSAPLKYDIIFCLTNAELAVFKGSRHFVNKIFYSYSNIYNINIDCVGLKDAPPLGLKNISSIPESVYLSDY